MSKYVFIIWTEGKLLFHKNCVQLLFIELKTQLDLLQIVYEMGDANKEHLYRK